MNWTEFLTESVTLKTKSMSEDASGSYTPTTSSGTVLAAKVDSQTAARMTDHGAILAETTYTVYFASEPIDTSAGARTNGPACQVDDTFTWGSKTLVALGPAQDMSALGESMWRVLARGVS